MWVFTTIGFFSIVAHRDKPGFVCVRARAYADLQRFISPRWWDEERPKIVESPEADYLFRIVARHAMVTTRLAELCGEINYDNFKNAVAAKQGAKRAHLYHDVWEAVRPLQYEPHVEPERTTRDTKPKQPRRRNAAKAGRPKS